MTKLDDFSKITHKGNEIGKVLHQGKTIWQKEPDVYLAQDSDFVKLYDNWVYKGSELEIEIPTRINGRLVTSITYMFSPNSLYGASRVTKVVLNHNHVVDMSYAFYENRASTLDLRLNTSNVQNMSSMFYRAFMQTLDLSSFDMSNVTDTDYMFYFARATKGYAKTQADADKMNSSLNKPTELNFVVKP